MFHNPPRPSERVEYNLDGEWVSAIVYTGSKPDTGTLNLLVKDRTSGIHSKLVEDVPWGNQPGTWKRKFNA